MSKPGEVHVDLSKVNQYDDYLEARIADLERQLVDERAQIDCATRGGWLSEDLECAGEDGPACWKHLLAKAQACPACDGPVGPTSPLALSGCCPDCGFKKEGT